MDAVKSNILVVGLLSTGSSALIDILREYENINIIPGEFNDFRAPGLVADELSIRSDNGFNDKIRNIVSLKNKLILIYYILPIFKFKTSILKGFISRFNYSLIRIKQLNLLKKLNVKLTSNISIEDKINYANQWINDIGQINNRRGDYILFNQPLLTVIDSKIWDKVFFPWKLIVVFRDPKDQLAEILKNGKLFAQKNSPEMNIGDVTLETIYGRGRKSAITIHLEAMKKRFEWIDSLKKEFDSDKILLIDFEGLVNKYELYKVEIENFIGDIKPLQSKIKKYFNPANAIKSLNIYKDYLTSIEIESLKELENWYSNTVKNNQILN